MKTEIVEIEVNGRLKKYLITYDELRYESALAFYNAREIYSTALSVKQEEFNIIYNEFEQKQIQFRDWQKQNDPNRYGDIGIYDENNLPAHYKEQLLREELNNLRLEIELLKNK